MAEQQFTVEEYSRAFKQFRNRYRKFSYKQLINHSISFINSPHLTTIEQCRRLPWQTVLLLKWVLSDPLCKSTSLKKLDQDSIVELLQSLNELSDKSRLPNDYENITLFLRSISVQQFPYQQALSPQFIARQSIFFSSLGDEHTIKVEFLRHTGLTINEYLDFSFFTYMGMVNGDHHNNNISLSWFRRLIPHYSAEKVEKYIHVISKPLKELKKWVIEQDNSGRRSASEFCEPSIFVHYPFILSEHQLTCIHPQLFFRSVDNFIFQKLRHVNKKAFMDKFTKIFESYVGDGLTRAGVSFINERQIMAQFGRNGLQIDFLALENGSNIFIEAKAAHLPKQAYVAHTQGMISDKLKTSAIKAIKQAHDVLNKMPDEDAQKDNYLIVVTYTQMYLGNGQTFHSDIATRAVDQIIEKYQHSHLIPLENIYFLTISDFDFLCEMVRDNQTTLTHALNRAKLDDSDAATKKLLFSQHLMQWWDDNRPEHLSLEFDHVTERLMNNLGLQD